MKIVLVGVTHPFRGGISHYSTLLCRALRERHDVLFLALKRQYPEFLFPGKTQKDESEDPYAVEHDACLDSINPLTWLGAVRRVRAFKPDFILVSWWHPFFAPAFGTLSYLSRWFGGVPSCYLCHNVLPHERSLVDRLLLPYALRSANVFITHSREDEENCKMLRPRARVFRNPHPTYNVFASGETVTEAEARERLGLTGKKVLLFFGFIRKYKGLTCLLEAMDELPADGDYHLLIVGEFYDPKSDYAEALDRLEARGQITVVDRYVANEEVPLFFAAADVLVAPYLTATQSGVVQIAYGFSKPVIASAVGGIPEAVVDGQTGYLVPPADPKALAAAIRRCCEEDDAETFREGIAEEQKKYTWEAMVATIEKAAECFNC